ncbi:MAG: oligosaccharide flippase family protein [bacterium]
MHYSLTRSTVWNLAGYVYLIIASLVSTPILLHSLGLAQFGQYGLIIASLSVASAVNLGLPQAVVRALARDHEFGESRQTLWATSSLLFILTGLAAGGVAVILSSWVHVNIFILILVFMTSFLNNVISHYATLPQAEGHFGYFNVKTFVIGTGNTFLAAFLASRGQGILGILTMQLFAYFLTLLPLVYFSFKFFPRPRDGRASFSVARSLLTFGIKSQLGKIVGQLQAQYGKYLLAGLSPLGLSAYMIAQGIVQKLVGSVSQLATALYPALARSSKSALWPLYLRLELVLFVLGFLGICLYSLVGYHFLSWWLHDPEIVHSVHSFILVYRYYGLLLLLTPVPSTILEAVGKPGLNSLFSLAAFMIELSIALYLYPKLGFMAPAYAGIISLAVMAPILLIFTGKTLSFDGTATRSKHA